MSPIEPLVFTGLAALTITACTLIAFSKNLVYSAFSLLGAFAGIAGLMILLGADFVGVIQILVYVGGILVLYLFAVLMTAGIGDVKLSNPVISVKIAAPALVLLVLLLGKLIYSTHWFAAETTTFAPTTSAIGETLLKEYLLPFELISILLLAALVGAVAMARREVKEGKGS
ncbi:MAG: NADH-quinone oxidoreductase subunit J [Deltaproteobacteria bacterium]|nr:NADH-quinone oxidoreductase subunit J [Deltaproteobacteria bacterium]